MGKGDDPNASCAAAAMSDLLAADVASASEFVVPEGPIGSAEKRSERRFGLPVLPNNHPSRLFDPDGRRRHVPPPLPLLREDPVPGRLLRSMRRLGPVPKFPLPPGVPEPTAEDRAWMRDALERDRQELAALGLEVDTYGRLKPIGRMSAPGTMMGSEPVPSAARASAASLLEQIAQSETHDEPQRP